MKFWVTQDRLVVDTATADLRGGLQDATEGTVTASTGSWSTATAPATDGSWRVSVPLEIGVNEITVAATDGAGLTTSWTGTVVRLITDRVQADLDAVRAILARLNTGTGTEADWAALNAPNQRGAYNDTDLNRVSAAAELVYQSLVGQGISVDYAPVELERPSPGRLPEGYTELEYIESSGTQWIDTGFKPNQDSRVVMDVQIVGAPTDHSWLFGARQAGQVAAYGFFWAVPNYQYGATYNTEQVYIDSPLTANVRLLIDQNKNFLDFNGVTHNFTYANFQTPVNLPLLGRNTNGTVNAFTSAKLFSCQIYDDGVMIRDFIPCTNPSGAVGVYDLVNAQFYGNAGSGAFAAGPEVPDPPPIIDYEWQETDIPTASQMSQYLTNVANLLGARLVQEPYITLPASMAGLTLAGANNIEWALVCVDAVTPVVRKSYIYSGEAMAGEF